MIYNEIKRSYTLAKNYVEKCCITVNQEGKEVTAFTEHDGKMRVTDWGGTSSAIYLFHQIGLPEEPQMVKKYNLALDWLIEDQAPDGSWEAAEMQCCEATSAVVFDLFCAKRLPDSAKMAALNYIEKCYLPDIGAFISQPNINQSPHIYTTYLATRALSACDADHFDAKKRGKLLGSSGVIVGEKHPQPQCLC